MFKTIFTLLILIVGIAASVQFLAPHASFVTDSVQYVPSSSRADTGAGSVKGTNNTEADYSKYIAEWNTNLEVAVTTDAGYSSNSNYSWETVNSDTHNSEIAYYQSFDEEITKYSADFFDNAGVTRIVLVDNIKTNSGISVLGFADPITGEIFFNIDGARSESGLIKSTIHHEIAHVAFYAAFGSEMYNLAAWNDIEDHSAGSVSRVEHDGHEFPEAGFVSSYARTSTAEDMAEVFAFMMTDQYAELLPEAQKVDAEINAKVLLVTDAIDSLDSTLIAKD